MGPRTRERDPDFQDHGTPKFFKLKDPASERPVKWCTVPLDEVRMAFRELTMTDVREVLRRWTAGQGIKTIAREACIDRKTIRRYVAHAEALGVTATTELTDDVVHAVAQCVQTRPLPPASDAWRAVEPHRDRIASYIADKLTLTKIHRLLLQEGALVTYATLRRFVIEEFEWGKPKATVRLVDPPAGEEAQSISPRWVASSMRRRSALASSRS
jgi:hypothetical protein